MHVKDAASELRRPGSDRGTYRALIERSISQDLGITAVELSLCFSSIRRTAHRSRQLLGLCAVSFSRHTRRTVLDKIPERWTVSIWSRLCTRGIEVILDVVFNHTAEGEHLGPTLSFLGLDNRAYYHLEHDHRLPTTAEQEIRSTPITPSFAHDPDIFAIGSKKCTWMASVLISHRSLRAILLVK
jgi:glycogen operon protein